MMAGADRVEGCLFGNGERSGNMGEMMDRIESWRVLDNGLTLLVQRDSSAPVAAVLWAMRRRT